MKNTLPIGTAATTSRIDVVDAMRGFAILAILLLHNLEHFEFYFIPPDLPAWMYSLDNAVFGVIGFLFSGKAYAIFALLFGFTFYLMDSHQAAKGSDFRLRFAWRMFLLLLFGLLNGLLYSGDILNTYAILGLALIPVCRLSNKAVLIIAALLLLQPNFWLGLKTPSFIPYFEAADSAKAGHALWPTIVANMVPGRIATYIWSWEQGRLLQTPALFMIGMLLGRSGLFARAEEKRKVWQTILIVSTACAMVFMLLQNSCRGWFSSENAGKNVFYTIRSWSNLSITFIWVSGLILLYRYGFFKRILSALIPFGRMSLTCYIMQSCMGAIVYHGFGFGLYRYTGATYSLLIGLGLFVLQYWFCTWWLKNHSKGPLEALWHRGTWMKFNS